MPRIPRPADPNISPDTVTDLAAVVRAGGPGGFEEARALARQCAPDAIRHLAEVVRHGRGSVFAQSRAAGLILEAAGLVRALPPGSAATPDAEAPGAGEE